MNTLLIVDFINTVFRGWAVNKELEHHGESTGGVYNFIKQLASIYGRFKFKDCIVCADSKPYLRNEFYPNYKHDRKTTTTSEETSDLASNFELTKELLNLMNIPLWQVPRLEADDLIGLVIEHYQDDYDSIIILSNDSDLYQLLTYSNVTIYKQLDLFTRKNFEDKYKFDPHFWPFYTALVGSHNGVPGVKGIGPVKAKQAIFDLTFRDELLKKYEKTIEMNYLLAEIPFFKIYEDETIDHTPVQPTSITANEKEFIRFLASKGIDYTYHMRRMICHE